jgi:hypothetical protein
MKFRLTIVAMALSVLAVAPVYAGGAGDCDYGGRYQSTSAEPQEQTEAAKKLASLSAPASSQETAAKAGASPSQGTPQATTR